MSQLYWYALPRGGWDYLTLRMDGRDACKVLGIEYAWGQPIMQIMDGTITGRPRPAANSTFVSFEEWCERFPYEVACLIRVAVTPQLTNTVPQSIRRRDLMSLVHCSDAYIAKAKRFYENRMDFRMVSLTRLAATTTAHCRLITSTGRYTTQLMTLFRCVASTMQPKNSYLVIDTKGEQYSENSLRNGGH